MKTLFPLFLSLAAVLLSACSESPYISVSLDGSTSMERVAGALIEGYREEADSVKINYSGTGSGAGIEAVLSGLCDIGLSSRALKDSEIRKGAVAHLIALDGIAVIVHPSNPVENLSTAELAAVFSGRITNWSVLGGTDSPIAVYGREAGSGTRTAFEDATGTAGLCRYRNEYNSTGDIVGNIASNPNGIGYVSLSNVGRSTKALRIDGIPCSEETIRSGQYGIQRPFLFVTSAQRKLTEATAAFLHFASGEKAKEYITIAGAVPPHGKGGDHEVS